jgi:hypothetical protein
MSTATFNAPPTVDTLAHFVSWAGNQSSQGISYCMGTVAGFTRSNDAGQVQWADSSSFTLSSITGNGTIWTGTTSTAHGFRAGQVVTIAGTTHFNGNAILLSASGTSFTITNATQSGVTDNAGGQTAIIKGITKVADILPANNTSLQGVANSSYPTLWRGIWSSGTTYAVGDVIWYNTGTDYNVFVSIAAANLNHAPSGGSADTNWQTYNYEIWISADSPRTAYYVKFEYGRCGTYANNLPAITFTLGTGSDGNSKLNGNTSFRELLGDTGVTSSTTNRECDFFCGAHTSPFTANGGNLALIMWRNGATTDEEIVLVVERQRDSTGATTDTSVTYIVGQGRNNVAGTWRENSLFLSGSNPICIAQAQTSFGSGQQSPHWGLTSIEMNTSLTTWQVGTNTAVAPVWPMVGYFANPLLNATTALKGDVVEGTSFTITMYGVSHTYLPTKTTNIQNLMEVSAVSAIAIRWE